MSTKTINSFFAKKNKNPPQDESSKDYSHEQKRIKPENYQKVEQGKILITVKGVKKYIIGNSNDLIILFFIFLIIEFFHSNMEFKFYINN